MPKLWLAVRELSISTPVAAPAGFSLAFLNTYVHDLGGGSDEARLPLHYTLTHLAGLTLEREVVVRVDYCPQPNGSLAKLEIAWEPDAALFPRFDGTLHAEVSGEKQCTLFIDGTYDAPGGVAGQLFDAVVGVRIAHGSLEQLLEQFRTAIEDDYRKRMDND